MTAEVVTVHLETASQVSIVEDLTVETDDEVAVGAEHRLMDFLAQVDNRQPAVAEGDGSVRPVPGVVSPRRARASRMASTRGRVGSPSRRCLVHSPQFR